MDVIKDVGNRNGKDVIVFEKSIKNLYLVNMEVRIITSKKENKSVDVTNHVCQKNKSLLNISLGDFVEFSQRGMYY